MPYPVGKLDPALLAELLGRVPMKDQRVLVGPRIGEDSAVIDFGDRVLVTATDPITFTTDRLGWYAVHVNANDVATMGARPRWFQATLLLPEDGSDHALVEGIFADLLRACSELDVSLIGGHTEVTGGLPRPIIVGQMMGDVEKRCLLRMADAHSGCRLLLCKGVGIEATSIIAREKADEVERVFGAGFCERAREFLDDPGISVVAPAMIAAGIGGVRAMHDPTEGGIATALREVGIAAGAGLRVRAGAIPVYPECERLCRYFGLDPFGVIASGALLIVVEPEAATEVSRALQVAGFPCAEIGTLTDTPGEYAFLTDDGKQPLPHFAVDEITRLFD